MLSVPFGLGLFKIETVQLSRLKDFGCGHYILVIAEVKTLSKPFKLNNVMELMSF